MHAGRVEVNFHTDLTRLIRETRYLDRMGFTLPEIALNVALQEDKFLHWLEGLNAMLAKYYQVGSSSRRGHTRQRCLVVRRARSMDWSAFHLCCAPAVHRRALTRRT
jgi:hypothetical protein